MPKCTGGSVLACMAACTFVVAVLLAIFLGGNTQDVPSGSPWTWRCEDQGTDTARCVKEEATNGTAQTLNRCQLTCGPQSVLWPATSVTPSVGMEVSRFSVENIEQSITAPFEVEDLAAQSLGIFKEHLNMYHPDYDFVTGTAPWTETTDGTIAQHVIMIQLSITNADDRLTLTTDEAYSMTIMPDTDQTIVVIMGATFFGVRHGLETLSQLINYDEENDCLQIVNSFAVTDDSPAYPLRGLMLDTARNFFTVPEMKRTIDAMAVSKLNTLHWHITDSQAFPVVIESLPNMHYYGAYSPNKVYYRTDIQDVVEYGRVRGVRVLPELDAPAHVASGWDWGPAEGLGNLTVCPYKEPWYVYCNQPPCGQLNLANPEMYNVLDALYQEFLTAFGPLDLFHYGGDEINMECWNTTDEITEWMGTVGDQSLSEDAYHYQWGLFQQQAHNLLVQANGGADVRGVLWSSSLTEYEQVDQHLNTDTYIIQVWSTGNDSSITDLLARGYDVIFSNYDAWYLDCGFSAWVGEGYNWCAPYKGWQFVYDNSPIDLVDNAAYNSQILGGLAVLFSEQVDGQILDSRLWPRASAVGERLWSNPATNWEPALNRMLYHRERLVKMGIAAEVIQPEWCMQNEGKCYDWGEI